jgi:hypothetical protein
VQQVTKLDLVINLKTAKAAIANSVSGTVRLSDEEIQ